LRLQQQEDRRPGGPADQCVRAHQPRRPGAIYYNIAANHERAGCFTLRDHEPAQHGFSVEVSGISRHADRVGYRVAYEDEKFLI